MTNINRYIGGQNVMFGWGWAILFLLFSCSDKDEPYPSVVTEFSDVISDAAGRLHSFTTDRDQTFRITNDLTGYEPNSVYRAVCGFVPQPDSTAVVYQLLGAWYLRDSTNHVPHCDPTEVLSVWRTRRFLNMQLVPRTQGGRQYWGFMVDSTQTGHVWLSLYHNQNGDEASYSTNVYASLPLDSVPDLQTGDSLSLSIQTFEGVKTWKWQY